MRITWLLSLFVIYHVDLCYGKLRLIQVVHRHGNRAPTADTRSYYTLDPYFDATYYPEGWGGLTNAGKMSLYNLGRYLRQRYGYFLGPVYTKDVAYFRADAVDRIVMSAQIVAAGLFPPIKLQMWNPELSWQPVPVWTIPLETDLLYNGIDCTNFQAMREKIEATDERLINRYEALSNFFGYLTKHVGSNMTHFRSFLLRQTLHAQMDLGLQLPEWTKSVFPDKILDEVAMYDLIIQSYTTEMKQLQGGQWLQEWLNHVKDHLNGTSPDKRKGFFYAAHELNLAAILLALKSFDNRIPGYSSAIIFELHEEEGFLYVQVVYKNENYLRILDVPGCGGKMCPLYLFRKVVAPVISKDPQKLCGKINLPF